MPSLDSCINSIFEPGNPGSATDSGTITVPKFGTVFATATQTLSIGQVAAVLTLAPSTSATATQSLAISQTATAMAVVSRAAQVMGVFVNSSGTSRQGNVDGVMVNL
jgi:hypothetical protein